MWDDRVWTESYIVELIDGGEWREIPGSGEWVFVGTQRPTYQEQRMKAMDTGNPELMLDAIQLDAAIDRLVDMPAKAAIHLKLAGWDEANLGAVLRDKRRRTGAELVASAVRGIARGERRRAK
jgi:hypothetical protein